MLFQLLTCTVIIHCSFGWDTDDLELFDIVEEVNRNFYEVLGVERTATSSEIKKAYRRLSLQLHPDKNKEEDAEVKFRQLVAVYEVLKDEEKRKRYNLVLENGLPDWRQPIFYYRRVRKMGLLEFFALICLITTVGQYIVMWAAYAERKFTLSENFSDLRKRAESKNRKARQEYEERIDQELEILLDAIPRPKLSSLWPYLLTVFLVKFILNSPKTVKEKYETWKESRKPKEEEQDDVVEEVEKKPKKRYDAALNPTEVVLADGEAVNYSNTIKPSQEADQCCKQIKAGEWTDEEIALLAKAANKFPGGTPKRWEKIADMVGRPVEEVIPRCQKLKDSHVMNLSTSVQGGISKTKKSQDLTDDIISRTDVLPEETVSSEMQIRKRKKPVKKTAERTLQIQENVPSKTSFVVESSDKNSQSDIKVLDDSDDWNKNQQTILEWALRQYPKGTDLRWDKIAEHIPGKTKEDCVARYKYLAELVKKKKEMASAS